MASDGSDYSRKLDQAVRELHANLLPHQPADWEIRRARDAELSQLRLKVVELESMLDDAIDERDAALEDRRFYEQAYHAKCEQLLRSTNAAARPTAGRRRNEPKLRSGTKLVPKTRRRKA